MRLSKNAQLQNYKIATTKKIKIGKKADFATYSTSSKTSKDLGDQLLHDLYSEVNSLPLKTPLRSSTQCCPHSSWALGKSQQSKEVIVALMSPNHLEHM